MNNDATMYMMTPVNDAAMDPSMYGDAGRMPTNMPYGATGQMPFGFGEGNGLDMDSLLGGQGMPDPVRFSHELETLSTIFGPDVVANVTQQLITEKLAAGAEDLVAEMSMPSIAQDAACECMRENAQQPGVNSGGDVGQAIESVIGDDIDQVVQMVLDNMREEMNDEMKRAFTGPGGNSQSAGSGGGAATTAGNAGGGGGEAGGVSGADGGGHGAHGAEGGHDGAHGAEGGHDGAHGAEGGHGGAHGAEGGHGGAHGAEGGHGGAHGAEGGEQAAAESGGTEESGGAEGAGGTEGAGGSGGTSGNATGNWLVILASVLGKKSGEHLKAMVSLGSQMGELDSKAEPEKFAQFQSEFQAESQIFKMFQEAISTMIKSIGEGMSSVARKS